MSRPVRDYATEKPVSNDVFEVFRRLYAYDKTPLDAKTDSADESSEYFRKERVSYQRGVCRGANPGNSVSTQERAPTLPGRGLGSGRVRFRHALHRKRLPTEYFKFLLRAGRAVLYPVYKGTFERRIEGAAGPNATRERTVQFVKDASRSVDFLESRPDIQKAAWRITA